MEAFSSSNREVSRTDSSGVEVCNVCSVSAVAPDWIPSVRKLTRKAGKQ